MQLWGRMAQQQVAYHHNQHHVQQPPQQPQFTGLASGLRPHFFAKSPTLSAILTGKPAVGVYHNSPPSTLRSATLTNQGAASPTPQQAMLATIASQTLLGKLGSAFWDAFSGGSSTSGRPASWDADKVRRVLEGTAVVRVVDIEHGAAPASSSTVEKVIPARSPSPRISNNFSEKHSKCGAGLVDMLGSLHI